MNYIIIPLPHLAFKVASWRITIDYFKLNEVMAPITGGISNMMHVRQIPNIYFTASKFIFFPSDLAKGKKKYQKQFALVLKTELSLLWDSF